MKNAPIPRLDKASELHDCLVRHCRLGIGDVWQDPLGKHKVGCLDAARQPDALKLMGMDKASLAIQDPPYNLAAFERKSVDEFVQWRKRWVDNTHWALKESKGGIISQQDMRVMA